MAIAVFLILIGTAALFVGTMCLFRREDHRYRNAAMTVVRNAEDPVLVVAVVYLFFGLIFVLAGADLWRLHSGN